MDRYVSKNEENYLNNSTKNKDMVKKRGLSKVINVLIIIFLLLSIYNIYLRKSEFIILGLASLLLIIFKEDIVDFLFKKIK